MFRIAEALVNFAYRTTMNTIVILFGDKAVGSVASQDYAQRDGAVQTSVSFFRDVWKALMGR